MIHGLEIACKPLAGYGLYRDIGYIGDLSEVLPLIDLGDMHLDSRNAYCLKGIQDRNGCVCICAGVDDNAVDGIKICLLDGIDQITFVIGLVELNLRTYLLMRKSPPKSRNKEKVKKSASSSTKAKLMNTRPLVIVNLILA